MSVWVHYAQIVKKRKIRRKKEKLKIKGNEREKQKEKSNKNKRIIMKVLKLKTFDFFNLICLSLIHASLIQQGKQLIKIIWVYFNWIFNSFF